MIEVQAVSKSFDGFKALDGLSMTVPTGAIYGLVGPNGAGKSTLLRILAGVYRPEAGEALLDGQSPWENPSLKARVRLLADEFYAPGQDSLQRMGKTLSRFYPGWDPAYFERLCRMFPVEETARYSALSKGNRRQAGLILSLASRPDLLLLDEVFDGLDPVVRKLVKKLLAEEVAERNMTVVLASHNLREMEDFCDTLALLHKGGLVLERELDQMSLYLQRVQAVFPPQVDRAALAQKLCLASWESTGSLCTFVARGSREEVLAAVDSFSPSFRETLPLSLEEVFICEMEASGYDMENILG